VYIFLLTQEHSTLNNNCYKYQEHSILRNATRISWRLSSILGSSQGRSVRYQALKDARSPQHQFTGARCHCCAGSSSLGFIPWPLTPSSQPSIPRPRPLLKTLRTPLLPSSRTTPNTRTLLSAALQVTSSSNIHNRAVGCRKPQSCDVATPRTDGEQRRDDERTNEGRTTNEQQRSSRRSNFENSSN